MTVLDPLNIMVKSCECYLLHFIEVEGGSVAAGSGVRVVGHVGSHVRGVGGAASAWGRGAGTRAAPRLQRLAWWGRAEPYRSLHLEHPPLDIELRYMFF